MIKFDESEHIYKVEGRIVPSVTQIIGAVRPDKPYHGRGSAAEKGTQVHKALQYFDEGLLDECPEEYMGYLAAYEFFKDSADWMPLEHNKRVYHEKLSYCGTIDVIGLYEGIPALLDFKTGQKDDSHLIQVTAYRMAIGYEIGFVLYLRQNGKFDFVPAVGAILDRQWRSHVDVYNWYKR